MQIIQLNEKYIDYVISIIEKRGWSCIPENEIKRWMNPISESICFVGIIDDKPMATGVFDDYSDVDESIKAWNTLLYVEPEFRGNGYGRMMTDVRFRWAKNLGHKEIFLDTHEAKNYHLKFGWNVVRNLNYQGENVIIMKHDLMSYDDFTFVQSKDIRDYSILLDALYPDFGSHFCRTILCWCDLMKNDRKENKFWEVWIIKNTKGNTIGICGLYSMLTNDIETLWLGWFGLIPELRNNGIGSNVLNWLKNEAKKIGATTLMSYIDKSGDRLSFYERNGFYCIGLVDEYISNNADMNIKDFESSNDFIIRQTLTEDDSYKLLYHGNTY